MVCSLQLEALQHLSDMPLIWFDCDTVAVPFNDTVEYSPAFLEAWVSPGTCFLSSYFWDIILMRNSTAVRCPPIVMFVALHDCRGRPPPQCGLSTHTGTRFPSSIRDR